MVPIKDIRAEDIHILYTCRVTEEQLEPYRSAPSSSGSWEKWTTRSRLGLAAWLPYRWGVVCPPVRPGLPRQLRPGGQSENTYPLVLGLSWVSLHQLGTASLPRVHAPEARVRRKSLGKRHLAPEVSKAVGAGAAGKTTPGRCKVEAGSPRPG